MNLFDTSMTDYSLKQAALMLNQSQQLFDRMIDESLRVNRALMDFEMGVVDVDAAMTLMFPEATSQPTKKKSAKPVARKEKPVVEPKPKTVAKPKRSAPVAAKTKAIATPPVRKDDLKLISGVGPGLEKKLQDAGITSFAQIAALTEAQIADLEANVVKFAGRIKRDDWMGQAKSLMAK